MLRTNSVQLLNLCDPTRCTQRAGEGGLVVLDRGMSTESSGRPGREGPEEAYGENAAEQRRDVREQARRQLRAVAISTAVLLVAGVVALVVFTGDGGEGDVDEPEPTGPAEPREPGEPAPPADGPEPGAHPSGLDPTHPLVGRSPAEARTVTPLVRVQWIDGEPMVVTMDLVPGRVGVAVEDGVIVAADVEGCEEAPPGAPGWVIQACELERDDTATVWGELVADGDRLVLAPSADADSYFEGMQVRPLPGPGDGGAPLWLDVDGAPVDVADLEAGQSVWLWISGACQESFPVQCPVDALVVDITA